VVPVTASNDKRFGRATWRLTLYYTLTASIVLVVFSALIYFLFIRVIPNSPEPHGLIDLHGLADLFGEPPTHELREHLFSVLIVTDSILFLLIVVAGFVISRATLRPIEKVYARQKKFVAEAAHELRTPLSVLTAGSSYLLSKERTREEYQVFTEVVNQESRHLTSLANDLLFLARSDEQVVYTHTEIDLSHLVADVTAHMRIYTEEKGLFLNVTYEPAQIIVGNEEQVRRLIMNLLKNAADYNVQNGTIKVTLERIQQSVVFTVRDSGVGIPEPETKRVFERFFKTDHARTAGSSGAGLGLSIVLEIANAHHATIELESEVGKGTTVTVRFPIAVATARGRG
jgi:signal transduction histidine kinase